MSWRAHSLHPAVWVGSFDAMPAAWAGRFALLYSNAFDHAYDPEATAREWRRVAQPGAQLALTLPIGNEPTPTDPIADVTLADVYALFHMTHMVVHDYDPQRGTPWRTHRAAPMTPLLRLMLPLAWRWRWMSPAARAAQVRLDAAALIERARSAPVEAAYDPVVDEALRLVGPVETALDIGAGTGLYTVKIVADVRYANEPVEALWAQCTRARWHHPARARRRLPPTARRGRDGSRHGVSCAASSRGSAARRGRVGPRAAARRAPPARGAPPYVASGAALGVGVVARVSAHGRSLALCHA